MILKEEAGKFYMKIIGQNNNCQVPKNVKIGIVPYICVSHQEIFILSSTPILNQRLPHNRHFVIQSCHEKKTFLPHSC